MQKRVLFMSSVGMLSILVLFLLVIGTQRPLTEIESPYVSNDEQKKGILPKRFVQDLEVRGEFRFAVLGDTQNFEVNTPEGNYQKAIRSIENKDVDFLISVGDQVSSCKKKDCEEKVEEWRNVLSDSLQSRTFVVMGNHDQSYDGSDVFWRRAFQLPMNGPEGFADSVYSFDYENAHFVFLNSDKPDEHIISQVQRDWLKKDLSQTNKKHLFIIFHEPAFPISSKQEESLDKKEDERDALWTILDEYNVTAVFNGHEHIHSRRAIDERIFPQAQNSIWQFIVGNTDAFHHDEPSDKSKRKQNLDYVYKGNVFLIVDVKDEKVKVDLHTVEGELVDEFEFSK